MQIKWDGWHPMGSVPSPLDAIHLYWTWDGLSTDLNFNWMMAIPKTMLWLKASSLVSRSWSLDGWLIFDYNRIDRGVLS